MRAPTELAKKIELWPISDLVPYARNPRTHSYEQIQKLAAAITEYGWTAPILVDEAAGIIAGHGRLAAAKMLGMAEVPVIELTHLTEAQKRALIIWDNKSSELAGWDEEMLAHELDELRDLEFDLALTGFSDKELADLIGSPDDPGTGEGGDGHGSLADRFLIPPFSVFSAREGWWQDRKRAWIALGMRSELGRGDDVLKYSDACKKGYGKTFGTEGNASEMSGTSIFDPVLCEIAYRWFSPKDGVVLDPFAGGSVRGIVAAKLGRQYVGNDLRAEQIEANRRQADEIMGADEITPAWSCGDSRDIEKLCEGVKADFIFSCPPYADLEVYSDDPKDLSTLGYAEFRDAYREIIAASCRMLKPNRFACFIVGEVRGKDGAYYNFVGDTVQAFLDAGLKLYNEAILVTAVGSLPIRAGKQFSASRKLGKTHQNVLVFLKGDAKKATAALGEIEVALPEGIDGGEDQA